MTNTIKRVTPQALAILTVLDRAYRDGREVYNWQIRKLSGCHGPVVTGVLARLEATGALTARWDDAPGRGPRRRYCRLTPEGAAEAAGILAAHRETAPAEGAPSR